MLTDCLIVLLIMHSALLISRATVQALRRQVCAFLNLDFFSLQTSTLVPMGSFLLFKFLSLLALFLGVFRCGEVCLRRGQHRFAVFPRLATTCRAITNTLAVIGRN